MATIRHNAVGEIIRELFVNNMLHSAVEPAYTRYHKSGAVLEERWYYQDMLHRDDGPAYILYSKSDIILEEEYFSYGQRHREKGPALIWRNSFGFIIEQHWYSDNDLYQVHKFDLTGYPVEKIKYSQGIPTWL